MLNNEFAKKYGYSYDVNKDKRQILDLHKYQKNILNTLDIRDFVCFMHSRQMGLSTLLVFHIANILLTKTSKPNHIVFVDNKIETGYNMLKRIKEIINRADIREPFDMDGKNYLKMVNGNSIKVMSSKGHTIGINSDTILIVDNAAAIKNLYNIINSFPYKKIILVSSKTNYNTDFYEIFNDEKNKFYKEKIKWELNPFYDFNWANRMKEILEDCDFKTEYELEDCENYKKENKDKTITIRLDNNTYDKLNSKVMNLDISLSEYIRYLIEKN